MKTKLVAASSAIIAAVGALASPAFADLKISETTIIDAPGMKSMLAEIPEDKRAPLLGMISPMLTGQPWQTTTWLKGNRLRTDMGQTTTVVNSADGKDFTLNRASKVYSLGSYDPYQKAAGSFTCSIAPTSQRSTMLGHPVARYLVSMTSSVLPNSHISGEIWSATDLPTPPMATYADGGIAAGFGAQMAKVTGMPLAFRLFYPNTPAGTITVMSYATSIETSTLSLADFRIPADYRQGNTRLAQSSPTTGYPLGDGLPLDSTSPVTDAMATGRQQQDASALGGGDISSLLGGLTGGQGLGGANLGAISSQLGNISPQMMQQLIGALGGLSGGNSSLGSSLGGLGGGSNSGSIDSLINPQMLQQLSSQLNSLLNDNE